jgi:hypothetical protein
MKAFSVLLISGWISGCGMFYGEIEEPSLCETSSIDIAGAADGESSRSIVTEFRMPSESHTLQDWGFKSGFKFSVTFEAPAGVSDLGFVDSAETRIHRENGSCDLGAVAGFQRNNSVPRAAALLIESNGPVDPLPCLDSSKLNLLTRFAGDLPRSAWSMNVKVCLSGKSRIDANSK